MLYNKQFGFRSSKSTELAVTYFLDHIRNEMNDGKLTGAVFVDLSKAFDTISHAVLLSKLPQYGVTSNELEWFSDYLFNRNQVVCFENTFSDQQPVYSGVPQGSVLGPLLFLIHLKHSQVIKFADDTVIYVSGKDATLIQSKLSDDMNIISNWLDSNDLIMNLKQGKLKLCSLEQQNVSTSS